MFCTENHAPKSDYWEERPLAYQELTSGLPGEAGPMPLQQLVDAPAVSTRRLLVAALDTEH